LFDAVSSDGTTSGKEEGSNSWVGGGVGYERPYFAYLLNTPALLVIVLLAGYPIGYSAWISLHKYSLKRPRIFDFVDLANYQQILQSVEFWSALWNPRPCAKTIPTS
jgi:ABC-type sugar transport system permease subunit